MYHTTVSYMVHFPLSKKIDKLSPKIIARTGLQPSALVYARMLPKSSLLA